jgi:hypothetical protein
MKTIAALTVLLISIAAIGAASANMGFSISMGSGATTFTDNMNFGPNTFQQNTGTTFSKTIGIGSDPAAGFCHGWTNNQGSLSGQAMYQMTNGQIQAQSQFDQGSAMAQMQFQDTGAKLMLVSGTQSGDDVNNVWTNAWTTNYNGVTSSSSANWQWQNAQVINGITMDRTTDTMATQFYLASPIVTPLTRLLFV